jgi:hypothetical protein
MKSLIFFLFLSSITFAQSIEGVVLDTETNKPVKAAHVYITNIEQGTITNYRGKFKLKLSNINSIDSFYVSHIGYKKQTFLYSKKKKRYIVYLETNRNELSEVRLSSTTRALKLRLNYNKLSSMKEGRYSFGSLLKDNKIYIIGGNSTYKFDNFKKIADDYPDVSMDELIGLIDRKKSFDKEIYRGDLLVYDLNLDLWESKDIKFKKRAYHNVHYSDNKFYVLGGKRISPGGRYEYLEDKIEVFNNESKTIQIDNTNPHQAVDFASFMYDNKIIVMGGSVKMKKNGLKTYTDKVHLFDLKTGLWYELASMPSAKETNGVLIDNKIFLMGGIRERPITSIESYDLISGTWEKEGDLFESFKKPAITKNGEVIYMFENGKMVTFNTKTKELNEYLIDLDLKESKLFYANNKLYVLGGYIQNSFSVKPSSNLYSIDIKDFDRTKVFKSKRL